MSWTLLKPKLQFPQETKVTWSQDGNALFSDDYGEGPFTVVYSYIERGGENQNGDEGFWWGKEKIVIQKVIAGT